MAMAYPRLTTAPYDLAKSKGERFFPGMLVVDVARFAVEFWRDYLYRFLAPQFAPSDEWVRLDQFTDTPAAGEDVDGEDSSPEKRFKSAMQW